MNLFYWESEGKAEVDLVIQDKEGRIVPIEVKSSENVKAKSLKVFVNATGRKYWFVFRQRISVLKMA